MIKCKEGVRLNPGGMIVCFDLEKERHQSLKTRKKMNNRKTSGYRLDLCKKIRHTLVYMKLYSKCFDTLANQQLSNLH